MHGIIVRRGPDPDSKNMRDDVAVAVKRDDPFRPSAATLTKKSWHESPPASDSDFDQAFR